MNIITKDKSFYKSLIALAVPAALQNLIIFAVGFADNLMVGALGDIAVSGVYMGGQIQTFLQIFSAGIEGTVLILSAQYWGKGDRGSIKKIVSVGLRFSLIFGAVITVLCFVFPKFIISLFAKDAAVIEAGADYLKIVCLSYIFFCITQTLIAAIRSVEVVKIGTAVSFMSLVINVVLNYVLIFGINGVVSPLGVKGAAIATLVSRIAETAVTTVYVFVLDKRLELKPFELLTCDRAFLKDFVKYGAPIIAGQLVWSVNMMANSAILGRFSSGVITAASVANTMHSLAYVGMNGMSAAVGIITGKTVGAGETEKMKEYAKTVQVLFFMLGLIMGGVITLLKMPFIGLYTGITPEATEYSRQFITVLSVTMIGTCYQAAGLFGLVKSGGDVGFVFKNDAIFVFLVVLPSAIIASHLGAPAWVVFACLKCDQILKCFVAAVKINKYNWMKNLTKTGEAA